MAGLPRRSGRRRCHPRTASSACRAGPRRATTCRDAIERPERVARGHLLAYRYAHEFNCRVHRFYRPRCPGRPGARQGCAGARVVEHDALGRLEWRDAVARPHGAVRAPWFRHAGAHSVPRHHAARERSGAGDADGRLGFRARPVHGRAEQPVHGRVGRGGARRARRDGCRHRVLRDGRGFLRLAPQCDARRRR